MYIYIYNTTILYYISYSRLNSPCRRCPPGQRSRSGPRCAGRRPARSARRPGQASRPVCTYIYIYICTNYYTYSDFVQLLVMAISCNDIHVRAIMAIQNTHIAPGQAARRTPGRAPEADKYVYIYIYMYMRVFFQTHTEIAILLWMCSIQACTHPVVGHHGPSWAISDYWL